MALGLVYTVGKAVGILAVLSLGDPPGLCHRPLLSRMLRGHRISAVTSEQTFSPYLLLLKTLERGKDDPMLAIVSGCFSLTQCSPRTIYIVFALQVGTLNPGD